MDINWIIDWEKILGMLVVATIAYVVVIFVTKHVGKRLFAKMSLFDFAIVIAFGSVLASGINSRDLGTTVSGLIILGLLQLVYAVIASRSKFFRDATQNKPTFVMRDGEILHDKLRECNMSLDDLRNKLRGANVTSLSDVKAVVFETTGDVSVITGDASTSIDPFILENVGPD